MKTITEDIAQLEAQIQTAVGVVHDLREKLKLKLRDLEREMQPQIHSAGSGDSLYLPGKPLI